MKKLKVALVLLLVFGAGAVFGVVATRVVVRNIIRRAISQPDLVRERIQRELVRRLDLNPQQREQVGDVLADTQKQLRDLRRDFAPPFAAIMSGSQTRISAILTPAQREKFDRIREENRRIFQLPPPPATGPRTN
jgi:Spy/CpxP family protein refolding chaperone